MGVIVEFTGVDASLRIIASRIGKASGQLRLTAERLDQARVNLQSAEAWGERALESFDRTLQSLTWTDRFCRQCLAATDLQDIEEMVRQRDELAETMRQQGSIAPSVKSLRVASAR